jgi:hypothetical protein
MVLFFFIVEKNYKLVWFKHQFVIAFAFTLGKKKLKTKQPEVGKPTQLMFKPKRLGL